MTDNIKIQSREREPLLVDPQFKALAEQIAEGFAQSLKGELIDPNEAKRILLDRHKKSQNG